MNFIKNDGGRSEAGFKGSCGDCVCRAVAIITNKPYNEVYKFLAENNRLQGGAKTARNGIDVKSKWFKSHMELLGFTWVPTMKIGTGCKIHLSSDELPSGKLVVRVSRHVCAVIDGVLHDTHDCSRNGKRCVYGYWKLG